MVEFKSDHIDYHYKELSKIDLNASEKKLRLKAERYAECLPYITLDKLHEVYKLSAFETDFTPSIKILNKVWNDNYAHNQVKVKDDDFQFSLMIHDFADESLTTGLVEDVGWIYMRVEQKRLQDFASVFDDLTMFQKLFFKQIVMAECSIAIAKKNNSPEMWGLKNWYPKTTKIASKIFKMGLCPYNEILNNIKKYYKNPTQ